MPHPNGSLQAQASDALKPYKRTSSSQICKAGFMSFKTEEIKHDAKTSWLGDKWCVERCFMGPSQGTLSVATCKLPIHSLFIFGINVY